MTTAQNIEMDIASKQSVSTDRSMRMMTDVFMFIYARKVREMVDKLSRRHCYGCSAYHPSQRNHSCLMMTDIEHLNMYFDDAVDAIFLDEILYLWTVETQLTDIPQDLKDTFIKTIKSPEKREQIFPSKDAFYAMVKKTIELAVHFSTETDRTV